MDWSHISAQSALYELCLHLFPLSWPWEFNFLVSPRALYFVCFNPRWIPSAGLLSSLLIPSSPPTFTTHQIPSLTTRTFTFSLSVQTHEFHFQPRKVSERSCSFCSRLGHLPPLFAVHLLAVVSMDVEWRPNPLKAHVGTVCISFSHLGERPRPSLFTGIPRPLSVQPQPTALA